MTFVLQNCSKSRHTSFEYNKLDQTGASSLLSLPNKVRVSCVQNLFHNCPTTHELTKGYFSVAVAIFISLRHAGFFWATLGNCVPNFE